MKNSKSKFTLEEGDGVVIASLLDENDYSLQHTIHGMPKARVRAPRRSKEQIFDDSVFMAGFHEKSQEEFLEQNIKGINHEINQNIQEIRKSLKRIQSHTHYVVTAQEILDEIKGNT